MDVLTKQPRQVLKDVFGYNDFRDRQEDIINRTIKGQDSLVIMPTGGGKSLCFQIPALCLDGTAIVISPLIALMDDQVMALRANNIEAAALHSGVSQEEERQIVAKANNGTLKLLYLSPERALQNNFSFLLREMVVSMIAIDEAHCVSMWGNDFRKEFTKIHQLITAFPNVAHIALTATADKATQQDICAQLKLNEPELYLSSFERKNISIKVRPGQDKFKFIERFVKKRPEDAGIIYCLSRKSTETVAAKLNALGFNADYYHAQMPTERKARVQREFRDDDIQIVCATIAFGMGIDKPNIRWVIHHNLPKNIESYYQEIGRAGRDGMQGEAVLFFSYRDIQQYRQFITDSPANEEYKQIQLAKLDRILEFAQASNCRTNIVLSYFGEHRSKGCGHCDICLNPPKRLDGTVIAQKALSAILRLKQTVRMNLLVDILRGSSKQEILERGYDKIKTYGAGSNISNYDWLQYMTQLINQGLIEIDYANHSVLKTTHLAKPVLFENKSVWLTQPESYEERTSKKATPSRSNKGEFQDGLFEILRVLRKEIAQKKEIPPYSVFPDTTLQEMVKAKPLTLEDFKELTGVGDFKLRQYGRAFIQAIQEYTIKSSAKTRVKGKTYIETFALYKKGYDLEGIAEARQLNIVTIASHLCHLYEKGEEVDLKPYISDTALEKIKESWESNNKTTEIKKIFLDLEETYPYYLIRIAITLFANSQ